jgi:hypothetical protein
MKDLKIDLLDDGDEYIIHLNKDFWIYGSVYPIYTSDSACWEYQALEDGSPTSDKAKARHFFDFSFCWRGVWEGRIYFKDEEYWSEELREISILWDKIESVLKELIMNENPDARIDD